MSRPAKPPDEALARTVQLDPRELLSRVLRLADTDGDGRITAADLGRGKARNAEIEISLGPGLELRVRGAERLSQLAALLAEQVRLKKKPGLARIEVGDLVVGRVQSAIDLVTRSWDGLTHRADRLSELITGARRGIFRPESGTTYVYVPASDRQALEKLRRALPGRGRVRIVTFPRTLNQRQLASLQRRPGLAYLPRPYLVPGGQFHEMYGWDSYFQALGALETGRPNLAMGIAENLIYQVFHYGKIANTNRSYHLSRSQPPLLSRLIRRLHATLPADAPPSKRFLRRGAEAVELALQQVWLRPPRLSQTGLSLYHDEAEGPVPEVPREYFTGKPTTPEFYRHDRALRESGWDLTHRFGVRAHRHLPVCLNALLYQYETDLAEMWKELEGRDSQRAARWTAAAHKRKRLFDDLFWDRRAGLYFDFDLDAGARTQYETLATFYPLWVGLASQAQADRVVAATGRFLERGGLATSSRRSRETAGPEPLQWDFPIGWAPLQLIAIEGLRRYGHPSLANEVAYRWLWMLLRIAGDGNGLIAEKYDVLRRSVEVEAEYANQGSDRGPYLDRDRSQTLGFGWTNASIPLLVADLPGRLRDSLDHGRPPRQLWTRPR